MNRAFWSWQKHRFQLPNMSSIMSNVTKNKNELWKTVRLISFQKPQYCNPFQSSLSLSIRVSFCICCRFAVLFIPFWYDLSCYFYVSLSLVEVPTVLFSWHSSFKHAVGWQRIDRRNSIFSRKIIDIQFHWTITRMVELWEILYKIWSLL